MLRFEFLQYFSFQQSVHFSAFSVLSFSAASVWLQFRLISLLAFSIVQKEFLRKNLKKENAMLTVAAQNSLRLERI